MTARLPGEGTCESYAQLSKVFLNGFRPSSADGLTAGLAGHCRPDKVSMLSELKEVTYKSLQGWAISA